MGGLNISEHGSNDSNKPAGVAVVTDLAVSGDVVEYPLRCPGVRDRRHVADVKLDKDSDAMDDIPCINAWGDDQSETCKSV